MALVADLAREVDLTPLNTLAVPARARYYLRIDEPGQLAVALAECKSRGWPLLILGGGSNVVLSGDFPGLVLHIAITGIEVRQQEQGVLLRVGAGENWDHLVRHCLKQGWYGLENLIAIPGSVGAAPIQNIGAYGVELSTVLHSVEGWDLDQAAYRLLGRDDCQLHYRDSIFKHALRDRFVISHVNLALSTLPAPHTGYPALAAALPPGRPVSPELVAETVAAIRASKLPDPAVKPNAGSFFKNPLVDQAQYRVLAEQFEDLPAWPMADGRMKLAAGWLVERCGFKGIQQGAVGIHEHQALVLVNRGGSGREILDFAATIASAVQQRFGVGLEIEPRVY